MLDQDVGASFVRPEGRTALWEAETEHGDGDEDDAGGG